MKMTIYLTESFAKFSLENHLRKFFIILIIVGIFGGGIHNLIFALSESEKDALLGKLRKTAYNFREVAPDIYRSGLISEEATPLLKEVGVKTVLSFDNNLKRARREEEFLKRVGIKFVSMPWSGWDYPKDETIEKAIVLLESSQERPILVHCKQGQERTGVVVACWRIAHQNWPVKEAYREMKSCGFRSGRYGHLKDYVYQYARKHGQQNAEISNQFERAKIKVLSFFYRLRKLVLN